MTIADAPASDRLRCPHCEQEFVVPGVGTSESDDDDWLSLDDAPPAHNGPAKGAAPASASGTGSDSTGEGSSLFEDDLPAFDDEPATSAGKAEASHAEAFADQFSGDDLFADEIVPPPSSVGSPPKAQSAETLAEYRVTCPVCGSMLYARAEQAGKKIKCHDCYSQVKVPPPPKKPTKVEVDDEAAESYRFAERPEQARPEDPFRKSASELLEAASRSEEEEPEPDFEVPKIGEWIANVFGIFTQPAVLFHWLVLSVLASVAAYIALISGIAILVMALFPTGFLFAAIVIGCGFAILESVANDEEEVTEWPLMLEPTEWIGSLLVALSAIGLAGVPAWALGQLIFGPGLIAVFLTMVAIYALFPFILLSMLDMQSVFVPFSPEVAKSITRCEESWGGLYFSSGVLFVFLFLTYVTATLLSPPVAAVVCIFATVGVAFLYFAMLGQLAYRIGQSINAAPMENDIEGIRRAEAEREVDKSASSR